MSSTEKKLTVLQVLPELNSGGVERGTLELSAHLAAHGHRSLVVSGGGRLVAQLEAEGGRHIAMPIDRKSPASLLWIPALRRLLQREKVDILHLRSRMPAWIAYLAWKSLPASRRPRLVTTFHGFYSINRYSAIMAKGERVIAVSRAIADHIREHYPVAAKRIKVIHRGVDIKKFTPAAVGSQRLTDLRRQWRLPEPEPGWQHHPVVMLPGRISRWKGHDVFLQSLAQIKDLPWLALCVGDTSENPGYGDQLLRLSKELDLDRRVKFVGHCADMPAALLLADLVVSPASTEAEAFGRVAVEAAAMGKPVIASAQGGSLETVLPGVTGWLVPPNDTAALATALRQVLADGAKHRRLGENGRRLVQEKFTTTTMCAQTLALYNELSSSASAEQQ